MTITIGDTIQTHNRNRIGTVVTHLEPIKIGVEARIRNGVYPGEYVAYVATCQMGNAPEDIFYTTLIARDSEEHLDYRYFVAV